MGNKPLSREKAEQAINVYNQCIVEGLPPKGVGSALAVGARRLNLNPSNFRHHIIEGARLYGLKLKEPEPSSAPPPPDTSNTPPRIAPEAAYLAGPTITITSRPDNTYLFGACGDQHIGSKYFREDVLKDIYQRYEKAKVQAAFNTGNWVDGVSTFNYHDLIAHGMGAQASLLAEVYPRHDFTTYAVTGADHEGWWAKREAMDVGAYFADTMRRAGRTDWHDLGFMEAHIRLVNANTGKVAILAVVHPGGGSAYALSYSVQKIVESLEGGEKPSVGLYGHYHKTWCGNIRNVWCWQTGCTQDQTPFMRQKKIEAHVGAYLVGLEQDPVTGAIIGATSTLLRYFNRAYYSNRERWSASGPVNPLERVQGAVQ